MGSPSMERVQRLRHLRTNAPTGRTWTVESPVNAPLVPLPDQTVVSQASHSAVLIPVVLISPSPARMPLEDHGIYSHKGTTSGARTYLPVASAAEAAPLRCNQVIIDDQNGICQQRSDPENDPLDVTCVGG